MKIRILMITYNRPLYTRQSLSALCDSLPKGGKVVVWDNASTEETKAVLRDFESDPRIEKIIYNPHNDKLTIPTNWFWSNFGDADFIGKVDDDCVVPPNWCELIMRVHQDIQEVGVIGCWHFLPEDFNQSDAARKVFNYGRHSIMRNCWVGGSGYLFKRKLLEELGILTNGESFTDYCIRAAAKGYVNGWYYPFLYQKHFDDPRWEDTGIGTDHDFLKNKPLSALNHNVSSRENWIKRLQLNAQMLQKCSFDPADYVGLMPKIKRITYRLIGKTYVPLVR